MNENTFFNLSPWNILNDMLTDRPFNGMFRTLANRVEGRFPPVNAYAGEKAVILDIEMPGKTKDDVTINIEPQAVMIEGKSKDDEQDKPFSRRFELNFPVDTEKAKATFKNGILRIELPKSEQALSKRIEIGTEA